MDMLRLVPITSVKEKCQILELSTQYSANPVRSKKLQMLLLALVRNPGSI